jgi:teichuronic acid biosynthesis glycosyltransferase TuaG
MSTKLISVIVPTYNSIHYLEECVNSIFAQTHQNTEIIFIDDVSTDDTLEKLYEYSNTNRNIRVLQNEVNRGPGFSRNLGIALAKGEYISFLDSDDVWHPEKLEKQVSLLESNADIDIANCFSEAINEEGKFIEEGYNPNYSGYFLNGIISVSNFGTSNVMIRKSAIDCSTRFSEDVRIGEDWEFWLNLALKHQVGYVPEVLTGIRNHTHHLSHNFLLNIDCDWKILSRFVKKNKAKLSLRTRLVGWYGLHFRHGFYYRDVGMKWRSCQEFLKAWLIFPWKMTPVKGIIVNLTR